MQKRAAAQEAQNVREIEAMVRDARGGGRGGDVKQAVQSVIQILRETHSDTKGGWMELRQELNDQNREMRDLRQVIKGNRTP